MPGVDYLVLLGQHRSMKLLKAHPTPLSSLYKPQILSDPEIVLLREIGRLVYLPKVVLVLIVKLLEHWKVCLEHNFHVLSKVAC
jgi:hypothetical protein